MVRMIFVFWHHLGYLSKDVESWIPFVLSFVLRVLFKSRLFATAQQRKPGPFPIKEGGPHLTTSYNPNHLYFKSTVRKEAGIYRHVHLGHCFGSVVEWNEWLWGGQGVWPVTWEDTEKALTASSAEDMQCVHELLFPYLWGPPSADLNRPIDKTALDIWFDDDNEITRMEKSNPLIGCPTRTEELWLWTWDNFEKLV